LHCVGLARAGRSVDEDSAILAVQKGVAKRLTLAFLENIRLSGILVQHFLEAENLLINWVGHSTMLDSCVKQDLLFLPGLSPILNYFKADRMLPF